MEMNKTNVTRQELYRLVWSTPLRTLAKGFGISDVGLAKACRRNNIPLPGLGYWAKVQAGKKVSQIPLPNSDSNGEVHISIIEKQPEHVDKSQLSDAEIILRNITNVTSSIKIASSLDSLHPIVIKTFRSLRNAPKNKLKILIPKTEQCLSISVSESSLNRALFFFDVFIRVLELHGCSIEPPTPERRSTLIHILGEKIPILMKEKKNLN